MNNAGAHHEQHLQSLVLAIHTLQVGFWGNAYILEGGGCTCTSAGLLGPRSENQIWKFDNCSICTYLAVEHWWAMWLHARHHDSVLLLVGQGLTPPRLLQQQMCAWCREGAQALACPSRVDPFALRPAACALACTRAHSCAMHLYQSCAHFGNF